MLCRCRCRSGVARLMLLLTGVQTGRPGPERNDPRAQGGVRRAAGARAAERGLWAAGAAPHGALQRGRGPGGDAVRSVAGPLHAVRLAVAAHAARPGGVRLAPAQTRLGPQACPGPRSGCACCAAGPALATLAASSQALTCTLALSAVLSAPGRLPAAALCRTSTRGPALRGRASHSHSAQRPRRRPPCSP